MLESINSEQYEHYNGSWGNMKVRYVDENGERCYPRLTKQRHILKWDNFIGEWEMIRRKESDGIEDQQMEEKNKE